MQKFDFKTIGRFGRYRAFKNELNATSKNFPTHCAKHIRSIRTQVIADIAQNLFSRNSSARRRQCHLHN